jgi:hypothetical protein
MISGDEYKLLSSSLCNFLHSHVTTSLCGPNILLRTLFSKTVSLICNNHLDISASQFEAKENVFTESYDGTRSQFRDLKMPTHLKI